MAVDQGDRAAEAKVTVPTTMTVKGDYTVETIIAWPSFITRHKIQGKMIAVLPTRASATTITCFPGLEVIAARLHLLVPRDMGTVILTMIANMVSNVATIIAVSYTPMPVMKMTAVKIQGLALVVILGLLSGIAVLKKIHVEREEGTVIQIGTVLVSCGVEIIIAESGSPMLAQKWIAVRVPIMDEIT